MDPVQARVRAMVAALWAGDIDEVERLGARVGPHVVGRMLVSENRTFVLAAIAAAPAVDDAWVLLPGLAGRAAGTDRRIAAEAARAAVRVARASTREDAIAREIPPDALRERLVTWRELGARVDAWPDVRVAALEVGAALSGLLGPARPPPANAGETPLGDDADAAAEADQAPFDLTARLADPEPEVRRAALELAPQPLPASVHRQVAALVVDDPDPLVSLVAAEALCAGLDLAAPAAGPARSPAASSVVELLGPAGIDRIRALVSAPTRARGARAGDARVVAPAPAARYGAARCLAVEGSPASRAAIEALARISPAELRPVMRSLLAPRRAPRRK